MRTLTALLATPLMFVLAMSVSPAEVHPEWTEVDLEQHIIDTTWTEEVQTFSAHLSETFGSHSKSLAAPILEASHRQQLPADLLAALVFVESSFRPNVVSQAGAVGPAQIRPIYWADHCGVDLLEPAQNIHCGAMVLRHYLDQCRGDLRCALRRYNVGPRGVREVGLRYAARVIEVYRSTTT